MTTLLIGLRGNKTLNRTVWPPELLVSDDLLTYRKRKWFHHKEISIAYSQIAQFTLTQGLFFASVEVVTTGTDDIIVRFVNKKDATKAKMIVDQKINQAHAKHSPTREKGEGDIRSYESSLARLRELLNRGIISKREYDKKKADLLKKMH